MTGSALRDIPGIGPKTIEKLFIRFKSIDGIQEANFKEVVEEIGASKASLVLEAIGSLNKSRNN